MTTTDSYFCSRDHLNLDPLTGSGLHCSLVFSRMHHVWFGNEKKPFPHTSTSNFNLHEITVSKLLHVPTWHLAFCSREGNTHRHFLPYLCQKSIYCDDGNWDRICPGTKQQQSSPPSTTFCHYHG